MKKSSEKRDEMDGLRRDEPRKRRKEEEEEGGEGGAMERRMVYSTNEPFINVRVFEATKRFL